MSKRMTRVVAAVAVVVPLLGLTACGGDEESSEPAVVAVEMTATADGKFELTVPEPVEAGLVRLEYRNATEDQADAQLIRVDGDQTVDEVLTAIGSEEGGKIPDWLHAEGGAGQIAAGATGVAELVLEEGSYFLVDTGEPEGDDVPSHAESGATATIEVTSGDDDAELPVVDVSIEMADYNFVPEGLQAGKNRLLLSNSGEEIHHTLVVPIQEGAKIGDVREFFEFFASEGPPSGPPPVDFSKLTGTSALDGGREQIAELELSAGRYAFLCFITDRDGGPPHVAKGMLREVTIEE